MDIFFVVTTAVVASTGVVILLLAWRIWRILGSIERMVKMAEGEAEVLKNDWREMRGSVRRGLRLWSFAALMKRFFTERSSRED